MMEEAASNFESIRASRGNYMVEVSSTGEVGLRERKKRCDKNPGHPNFIPVPEFNIEHLPSRYRDKDLVDLVRATSAITCRLSVACISGDRPDTWPDSDTPFPFSAHRGKNIMMTGTGWVKHVSIHHIDCDCEECCALEQTPKKAWGEICISTACHVVYDDVEARRTKCHFFYDSHETDINNVLTLTGLKVVYEDAKADKCVMKYLTHDLELLERFDNISTFWNFLRIKVYNKFLSNKSPGAGSDPKHDLCILVSHPHGCTKQVAVGTWTQRHVEYDDSDIERMSYNYNTPTCPGSSGAAVITLYNNMRVPGIYYDPLPHSAGCPGNDNKSGTGYEMVAIPPSPPAPPGPRTVLVLHVEEQDGVIKITDETIETTTASPPSSS